MGYSRINRIGVFLAFLAVTGHATASDFYSEVVGQLNHVYGGLGGLKECGSFLNPLSIGQFRVFKREGGTLIPLQRNPNDFWTAELQADPLSWISSSRADAVRKNLVRTTDFGRGQIDFRRENTNERRLDGILHSLARILDVDISAKDTSGLSLSVAWDRLVLEEFTPSFLGQVTQDLRRQGKDPYGYFKGVDTTHESWMVNKTLLMHGLRIKVTSENPSVNVDLLFRNVVRFGKTRSTEGEYCLEFESPVTLAGSAVNISRGDIYRNAGLALPVR